MACFGLYYIMICEHQFRKIAEVAAVRIFIPASCQHAHPVFVIRAQEQPALSTVQIALNDMRSIIYVWLKLHGVHLELFFKVKLFFDIHLDTFAICVSN